MDKIYTIKEVSDITKQSIRTIQRRCKALNVVKVNSVYQINKSVLKALKSDTPDNSDTTRHDTRTDMIQEGFTPEEYEVFKKRLTDYPYLIEQVKDLKNQVEYFKKSLDKQAQIFEKLTDSINNNLIATRERNAIEYKRENNKPTD